MSTSADHCGQHNDNLKATCIKQPEHDGSCMGITFDGRKVFWVTAYAGGSAGFDSIKETFNSTRWCDVGGCEGPGVHEIHVDQGESHWVCEYHYSRNPSHHPQPPVIEPTDAFCEHGNPAEMPCINCRQPLLNEDIVAALEDFKALSSAFVNLSRSMIQGFQKMNEAMARFENQHGENLRVLLHEAQLRREAQVAPFGKRIAGDMPEQ